jgi:uncharacterized phage protein gp47/JayE
MSTAEITIAPLPTTEEVALTLLQWLFATIGVPTDYNIGSIVRTYSEAIGSVAEIEGVSAQAEAIQAMVFAAYSVFGISPLPSTNAQGAVTFSTLSSAPLPPGQSVLIPQNTAVQTQSGVQFVTTSQAILVSGTTSVTTLIQALIGGSLSNVSPNAINQIVTGLSYPLAVTNNVQTSGGSNAETGSETLARFLAYVYSLGLCSPIAIASACIGVAYQSEEVLYATCYEPWIAQVIAGNTSPTAGFQVYIDNGTGNASVNLVTAVTNYLNTGVGVNVSGAKIGNGVGYRPAGVPYSVNVVVPVTCSVVVTAFSINPALAPSLTTSITSAINAYFTGINFGDVVELSSIIAAIADVSFGQLTSLQIALLDSVSTQQNTIPGSNDLPIQGFNRVILSGAGVTVN